DGRDEASLWIEVSVARDDDMEISVHTNNPSNPEPTHPPPAVALHFILYDCPNTKALQYFSLQPLELDLPSANVQSRVVPSTSKSVSSGVGSEALLKKLEMHATGTEERREAREDDLPLVLEKMNASFATTKAVNTLLRPRPLLPQRIQTWASSTRKKVGDWTKPLIQFVLLVVCGL
ncbi:hypothetical protein HK102_006954, partial [Quaeritorhiza haematococci]